MGYFLMREKIVTGEAEAATREACPVLFEREREREAFLLLIDVTEKTYWY